MPLDCDLTCGDQTFAEFKRLSEIERGFLLYCALNSAASQGNPELIGVYEVTVDADYDAPADASLIIWNVPAQSDDRVITFNGNPGQETQVLVIDSNGFNVGDSFTGGSVFLLNDVAPYVVNVRVVDSGTGEIVRSDGTAAQYDVGTSGSTIGLLNTNWIKTGTTEFRNTVELDTLTQLRFGSPTGPFMRLVSGFDGIDIAGTGASGLNIARFLRFSLIGTNDGLLQLGAPAGGFGIVEAGGNGLILTTNAVIPISVRPNRGAAVADFTTTGTLIATANGVGGARVAKWLPGAATMAAGTTGSIADTSVTAGSFITVTPEFAPAGRLYYTINAGVGFTILSTDAGDAGRVSYQRIVPG